MRQLVVNGVVAIVTDHVVRLIFPIGHIYVKMIRGDVAGWYFGVAVWVWYIEILNWEILNNNWNWDISKTARSQFNNNIYFIYTQCKIDSNSFL